MFVYHTYDLLSTFARSENSDPVGHTRSSDTRKAHRAFFFFFLSDLYHFVDFTASLFRHERTLRSFARALKFNGTHTVRACVCCSRFTEFRIEYRKIDDARRRTHRRFVTRARAPSRAERETAEKNEGGKRKRSKANGVTSVTSLDPIRSGPPG